jgi:acetyl esterase/lipase
VTLDPKAQALLDEIRASGRPNAHLLPVSQARANFEALYASLGAGRPVQEERDLEVPVPGARIPARVYRPAADGPLPLVVYFHGGGWLLGSIDSHDVVCRALANASGAVVTSVGYRLAPEHKFPTAVTDAYNGTRWLAENAGDLGADRNRVAVGGDSAGGNLAAVVALEARELTRPRLAFQLLVYPVTTTDLGRGFDPEYEGFFLYRDELLWHQEHYLRTPEDGRSPLASPLDAPDLRGLPPAFVLTAECDPLRPQGEAYAARLHEAGVAVELKQYPGMIHGFFGLDMLFDVAATAMTDAGEALRRALAG